MNCADLTPTEFRAACSMFPSGVTVTTLCDRNGEPLGITVSSFTSVSLTPPLVLVCIDHRSSVLRALIVGSFFGVNVLSESQEKLSVQFSRACAKRFVDVRWYPGETGVPLFSNVSAAFECRAIERIAAGDHLIVIGEVLRTLCGPESPLAYVNSRYASIRTPACVHT
jgi:flavin reductase (DIM6/NTAB) family NADH-FMN oxidoreductase RutF